MYAIVGEPRFLCIGHGHVLKTQFWRRSVGKQPHPARLPSYIGDMNNEIEYVGIISESQTVRRIFST
jgi:hypothetical protein